MSGRHPHIACCLGHHVRGDIASQPILGSAGVVFANHDQLAVVRWGNLDDRRRCIDCLQLQHAARGRPTTGLSQSLQLRHAARGRPTTGLSQSLQLGESPLARLVPLARSPAAARRPIAVSPRTAHGKRAAGARARAAAKRQPTPVPVPTMGQNRPVSAPAGTAGPACREPTSAASSSTATRWMKKKHLEVTDAHKRALMASRQG